MLSASHLEPSSGIVTDASSITRPDIVVSVSRKDA
jgi:hypothetical protein